MAQEHQVIADKISAPAALEAENGALKDQLSAVGQELAAARVENTALHDQLVAVGAELADSRAKLDAAKAQIAKMVLVDPERALAPDDGSGLGMRPEVYVASVRQLEDEVKAHPHDDALRFRLAQAYLFQPVGGPPVFDRFRAWVDKAFDPEAALAVLAGAIDRNDHFDALQRSAQRLATPPMIIAALPKSGSVFLFASLRDGLGKPPGASAYGGQFPFQSSARGGFGYALRLRAVVHSHLSASRANLIELFGYFKLDRLLVQVRDPRQALISWFHFMPSAIANADHSLTQHWQVPADYGSWTREKQFDWCIDGWYRWEIEWISQWVDAAAQPELRDRILFTRFEDMVSDQAAYFARILDFYRISSELFDPPAKPKALGEHNFRRGLIDEWHELLTPQQVQRVSESIPDALYERFGWPRN